MGFNRVRSTFKFTGENSISELTVLQQVKHDSIYCLRYSVVSGLAFKRFYEFFFCFYYLKFLAFWQSTGCNKATCLLNYLILTEVTVTVRECLTCRCEVLCESSNEIWLQIKIQKDGLLFLKYDPCLFNSYVPLNLCETFFLEFKHPKVNLWFT